MFRTGPLFVLAYALLWPPLLLLVTYSSHDAAVWGLWSKRLFAMIAAYGVFLLAITLLVVWCRVRSANASMLGSRFLDFLRRGRWRTAACVLPLACAWVTAVCLTVMMGPSPALADRLTWTLFAIAIAIVSFGLALPLAGRDRSERRRILMQFTAACLGLLVAIGVVEIGGRLLDIEPEDRWTINPPNLDVHWKTLEFDTRVTTNSQGLREPETIPRDHDGIFRVMVVGDSMTFGQGVNDDETFSRIAQNLLRRKHGLRDIEIINVSRRGAGPGEYLQFVRHFGRMLKPDLIVLAYYTGNDTPIRQPYQPRTPAQIEKLKGDVLRSKRNHFLMKSLVCRLIYRRALLPISYWKTRQRAKSTPGVPDPIFQSPNALGRLLPADGLSPDARGRFDRLEAKGWIDKALNGDVAPSVIEAAIVRPTAVTDMMSLRDETRDAMLTEWNLCERILEEIVDVGRAVSSDVWFMVIPHLYQTDPRAVEQLRDLQFDVTPQMVGWRKQNDLVCEFCVKHDVMHIDAFDDFRHAIASGTRLFFPIDSHCTPEGHRLLAELLADRLSRFRKTSIGK